jgi:hypothetical protein
MKKWLSIACLWVLGGILPIGCGNYGPQNEEEAPLSSTAESEDPAVSLPPEESAQESEEAASDEVEELSACCHVKCSNGTWYGPFKSVRFDHCKEYGKYYCPAHKHGNYASHAWKGC